MANILSRLWPFGQRAAQLAAPRGTMGQWFSGIGNLETNPYQGKKQALGSYTGRVYACVNRIAEDEASASYYFWRPKGTSRQDWAMVPETAVDPLIMSILKRPNAYQLWSDFIKLRSIHKSLTGESYIHLITDERGRIMGLELIYPHWVVEPIFDPERTMLESWRVQVPGFAQRFIPAGEVITDFFPHPTEPHRGMSPVEAFALSYDLDVYARAYGVALLKNRAVPDVILTTEQVLSPDGKDAKLLEQRWKDKYKAQAGGVAVLGQGTKVQTIGLSPQDLAFLDLAKLSEGQIAEIYGVPESKLGKNVANRSVAEQMDSDYNENVILPRLRRTDEILNVKVLPKVAKNPPYFEHESPVKQDEKAERDKALEALKAGTLKVNQYLERIGYPSQGPEGDVFLLPSNVTILKTLEPQVKAEPKPEQAEVEPDQPSEDQDEARALREKLRALEAEKLEKAYYSDLRGLFARFHREAKSQNLELYYDLNELEARGLSLEQLPTRGDKTLAEHYEHLKGEVAKQLAHERAYMELTIREAIQAGAKETA